jgi:positive regulator of sigma E activity
VEWTGFLRGVGRLVVALTMDIFYAEMVAISAALMGTALRFWTWRKLHPVCQQCRPNRS